MLSAQSRILQLLPTLLNYNRTGSDFPAFCAGAFFPHLFRETSPAIFPRTFLPQAQSPFDPFRRAEISLCCGPKGWWLETGEYSCFSNGKL